MEERLSRTAQSVLAQLLGEAPVETIVVPRVEVLRKPDVTLLTADKVKIEAPYNADMLPDLRKLPGRRYANGNFNHADLHPALVEFAEKWDLVLADDVVAKLAEVRQAIEMREQVEEALREASTAASVPEEVAAGIALAQYLYDFQVAGAAYALNALRTFIGDQMGLGKTRQALAVVETKKAYPALVICKAKLKSNFYAEITGHLPSGRVALTPAGEPMDVLLPDAKVVILDGMAADEATIAGADIVIVNYDILTAWAETLIAFPFQSVIIDESHYFKNHKAKRTQAGSAVVEAVRERTSDDAPILLLTGTKVLNRADELIMQLRIMGRLEDIAPKPWKASGPNGTFTDRDWEFSFKFRYCDPERTPHGWKFNGFSNEQELNQKLRATCMVRRLRREVTDLRDTKRKVVYVSPTTTEMRDYRKAESDLALYMGHEVNQDAEALAKLTVLRQLVGKAKINSAIEWIDNFLDSNEGEKLLVFAHHVAVQRALTEHYGCPAIYADQKTKDLDDAKEEFQQGDARIIVISMEAGREGHTLTAAHNVLFVEMGWTPGGMEQAEDRANRIGQRTDVDVVAWYLLAEDTIDADMYVLVETKRQGTTAVQDGVRPPESETVVEANIKAEVLRRLALRVAGIDVAA